MWLFFFIFILTASYQRPPSLSLLSFVFLVRNNVHLSCEICNNHRRVISKSRTVTYVFLDRFRPSKISENHDSRRSPHQFYRSSNFISTAFAIDPEAQPFPDFYSSDATAEPAIHRTRPVPAELLRQGCRLVPSQAINHLSAACSAPPLA